LSAHSRVIARSRIDTAKYRVGLPKLFIFQREVEP